MVGILWCTDSSVVTLVCSGTAAPGLMSLLTQRHTNARDTELRHVKTHTEHTSGSMTVGPDIELLELVGQRKRARET